MGRGVALGPEFRNRTCTYRTCGCDTAELPVPVLHPTSGHATWAKFVSGAKVNV